MGTPDIVECCKIQVDWTLLDCSWIPSSPRLLALGSTLEGQGRLAIYSLSGKGLTELAQGSSNKAIRCGTFRSSSLEDRLLVTGDFCGRLEVWDTEDITSPLETVVAHGDLINDITGSEETERIVTGARDGKIRVWDKRKLSRSAVNIEGQNDGRKQDCWSVASTEGGNIVVGGYSNGDIRMFDLRNSKSCMWATSLPGGITSISLDKKGGDKLDRLVCGTVTGRVFLWDLQTRHKTQDFTRIDTRLEKDCIWSIEPCPQNEEVLLATLQGGSAELLSYKAPGHRVMIAADGGNMGTPGSLERGITKQITDKPVTSLAWSPDKAGLLATTSFDQALRVCIATNI